LQAEEVAVVEILDITEDAVTHRFYSVMHILAEAVEEHKALEQNSALIHLVLQKQEPRTLVEAVVGVVDTVDPEIRVGPVWF
jgi:hypothetical protein